MYLFIVFFFFFKQKTAYEMRISDWSSDVCSSDLNPGPSGELVIATASTDASTSSTPADGAQLANCSSRTRMRWPREPTSPTASSAKSEERRVGKEGVSTCRYAWSPSHSTQTQHLISHDYH